MIGRCARLALAAGLAAGCALESLPLPGAPAPFLYRIEGQPPSHLFGTIHVPDERVRTLAPAVRRALAGSAVLYTEVPLEPGSRENLIAAASAGRSQPPPLRERLPDDLYERLERYLALKGLPMRAFDRQEIWSLASALPLLDYLQRLQTEPVLDEYLAALAREWGMRSDALETVTEQVQVFRDVEPGAQVRLLERTLGQLERDEASGTSAVEELVRAYLSGREDALLAQLTSGEPADAENAALMKRMLDDRSATMAERIQAELRETPGEARFFAIGAGHLPGAHGVVARLRAAGHQVRRIYR